MMKQLLQFILNKKIYQIKKTDLDTEEIMVYQYSKSWVFKLSLVFFTATVHLQHIGINLANLLIFACKL